MAILNTTSTLSPEVSTYYEKVFLARAEYELLLKQGGQMRTHSSNEGKTVNFTRYTPLTINTTALTEGCNPSLSNITASTIAVTLAEYGQTVQISKFESLTSIDKNNAEKIALVGQNMGESLNRLVRNELMSGTKMYGNDHSISAVAAGDTLDSCDIRMAVSKLEANLAMPYPDGFYLGKVNPYSKYTLLGDSTWVAAKEYSDVKDLYKGEIGELYQVRFILNKDTACGAISGGGEAMSTAASAVLRTFTYIHGKDAFGVYDLAGDTPKLYILPNVTDSGSPAGRTSLISWAGSYAVKLLNSDWIIRLGNTKT
jgi:N4-gp56 family major capsid protein